MKNYNKIIIRYKIIFILFICLIICDVLFNKEISNFDKINKIELLKNYNGFPIDLDTGFINNEYWSISSIGTNPQETKLGLNNAIKYAYENNIEYLKLEKGIYLINCDSTTGISIKSNINLDLNGSIIKILNNEKTHYSIITIYNAENVSVSNGILIGDRYEHDYSTINSSHEWGNGILIGGSNNISINNLDIMDTTGDGIFIDESYKNTNNVSIKNSKIHNTRRQGISIIAGNNINIEDNEIYDINGTNPQCGIDLEKNINTQEIKDIFINNNKIYNCIGQCIYIHSYVENLYMDNNELYGNIGINSNNNTGNESIHLGNNTFKVSKTNDYSNLTTDITDTFVDINLKNAILEMVGKTNEDSIYESDIAKIASDGVPGGKQLNLANKEIEKLDGIEIFAKYNIEWIYLDNNNITDLSPIASFTTLTKLNASNNKISDISTLENLTNLKTINLTNNNISEISVLNNKNNLEYLYLNNNKINSLDSLSGINTIKELYCSENEIDTIDNIINISSLEKLDVRKNKIKNILTEITSETLKYLNLSDNLLNDISGLQQNSISNLNIKNQNIEFSTGEMLDTEYVLIKLPQIFSTIDDTYNVELKSMSYYEFQENYNAVIVLTSEFIQNGLNIKVSKDDYIYLNYTMQIDSSTTEKLSEKFSIQKSPNEFMVSGINLEDKKIDDFINNSKFEDIYTVTFYKNDNILNSDDIITTGTIMRVYNYEKEFYQDYTMVIYGDVNGDGEINSLDALKVVSNKINIDENTLDNIYLEAGRTTEKTRTEKLIPNAVDALAIVKDKLGMQVIKQ